MGIGQVVVNPPGQCPPVGPVGVPVGEPRDDDTGGRPHAAIGVAAVPDVSGVVLSFEAQLSLCRLPKSFSAAERNPLRNIDAAEGGVQRFQQLGAQPAPGGDSEVRVVRYVGMPWIVAISLNRKSRRKNESDRRVRPRFSRPLTEAGVFTADRPGGRWRRPSPWRRLSRPVAGKDHRAISG